MQESVKGAAVNIPKRVNERIRGSLKKYRTVLGAAKAAGRGESDTATIVTDLLAEMFGYDKYAEISAEYQIRGTYCDLAVKIEERVAYLIEVKAVDHDLRDRDLRQSTDYAAKEGVEWVVLTNGVEWKVHKMSFQQPVSSEEVFCMNLLEDETDIVVERVFVLSREGISKSVLEEYHAERQAADRHVVAAAIAGEAVLTALRRELKRLFPGVRIEMADVERVIATQVFKRDIVENERYSVARKRVAKCARRRVKKKPQAQPGAPLESARRSNRDLAERIQDGE